MVNITFEPLVNPIQQKPILYELKLFLTRFILWFGFGINRINNLVV